MYKGRRAVIAAGIFLFAAALAGTGYYIRRTYTVKNVYVEGNVHYTEEEIRDIVMDGPLGDNSLFLSFRYKNRGIENVPFVDVMDVDILAPDTIKIIVYEKTLTGYVKYLDTYMYFDKDGDVVESSGVRTVGVPQITGLTFDHVVLGEKLPVEDGEVFDSILTITRLLKKYELAADRIYFSKAGDITIYFGAIKVAVGRELTDLEDKLRLLPQLLQNLEGKEGTLRMENLAADSGRYVFKPE